SKIRPAADRVKTDRRDAERLARLLRLGEITAVRVPGPEEEAARDLVRAREDARGDLMRARHRLSKLLLRHGHRYEGRAWRGGHGRWLGGVELACEPAQLALLDYAGCVELAEARRDRLDSEIARLVPESPWAETVERLRCLRGVDTLTAVGLCSEVGDFRRFARPTQLMSYLGLVPSEASTGDRRRL